MTCQCSAPSLRMPIKRSNFVVLDISYLLIRKINGSNKILHKEQSHPFKIIQSQMLTEYETKILPYLIYPAGKHICKSH